MSHEIIDYKLGPYDLRLKTGKDAFIPNLTTQLLAEHVQIKEGDTVLDLGCGVGPLAIWAAKQGAGKVYAVDLCKPATEYAKENVRMNGVENIVDVRHGDLFEPLAGLKFDVIIDDVSGMAEKISRISPWYPDAIPTGGGDGTGPTIRMLSQARDFFAESCSLYFPVLSLCDSRKIMAKAVELYDGCMEKLADKMVPFCNEFKIQLDEMEQLKEQGLIDYVRKRSRYLWQLEVYRITAQQA